NGSVMGIEGIISPCGKVFGRMGHPERFEEGLFQNVPGVEVMNIFKNGVEYFNEVKNKLTILLLIMFNSLFGQKETTIKSYDDFWNWFLKNEKTFFDIVKNNKDIEKNFLDKISPKLDEMKDGFWYLTGMYDENTVELIITADGYAKNIVFVEELIEKAPEIKGWKFTALKPAMELDKYGINMGDYKFNGENLFFYANEHAEYPDEIDISIVHSDLTNDNRSEISNGIYIFLDNYLGELSFLNDIDNLNYIAENEADKELIPISKLKEFIHWRQKEFVEKYDAIRYNTKNDNYSLMEAELNSGNKFIATINSQLLNWDSKPSHPWIVVLTIKYDGSGRNGMPDNEDYQKLNQIEDDIIKELKEVDGYLNIGRQTAESEREIYFACKDFRKPAKVLFEIQKKYSGQFAMDYDIYKDKYWRSFERFVPD
ncbi:MAG: phosphoribosylformylglycinamidine synthase subunit PurQ, partial [Weeksellaceae bacterium]|nr:phosphoribosylformylglycinamidine synthase subunit PurQ [Weeksellaceae bacterium]